LRLTLVGILCLVAGVVLLDVALEGSGFSLKVDQSFATYQEAVDAFALHEGSFIPPCTPKSATNIHDIHDADINTGHGSFEFDVADAEDFKKSILGRELSLVEREESSVAPTPQEDAYRLEFHLLFVDWRAGTCRWLIE
jgi:hypothetical protein